MTVYFFFYIIYNIRLLNEKFQFVLLKKTYLFCKNF